MTRPQWLLCGILVVELAAGAVLLQRRRVVPVPPIPDLASVDPLAARRLRDLAERCRTPEDWARLGAAYLAFGYFEEGEACARRAAHLQPESPERAHEWAFALERLGQLESANEQYRRGIERNHPAPEECWYWIGRNLLRQEKPAEAMEAFEKADLLPMARLELARLHLRAGRFDQAAGLLDPLARLYPKAIQPHLLRHRLDLLRDRPTAALHADLAARAPGRLPTPFDREWERLDLPYRGLGLAGEWEACKDLLDGGGVSEAETRLGEALRMQWEPTGCDLLAEVMLRTGRPAEGVRLLREAVERAGPSVHLLTRLGDAQEMAGRLEDARASWARAVRLGQGGKDALFKLGQRGIALQAAGHEAFWSQRYEAARSAFEQATEQLPELAAAWAYLGECRRLLRQPGARAAYERCLTLDPDHGRALAGLRLLELAPSSGR